jgi:hippurate hydrolase
LSGDARALDAESNAKIEYEMRRIVEGACIAHGVTAEVIYDTVFNVTMNAPKPTQRAAKAAIALAGASNVDTDCAPVLGSEDFAHMANARPGCFIFMGNGVADRHAHPLHSADYDFNDDALTLGSSYWVELVEQELASGEI